MAYFKFLKFKIRRKVKHEDGQLQNKTHAPLTCEDFNKSIVKRFCWKDVVKMSMKFSNVIGEGGFSTVFLASFSNSSFGALKVHRTSERLSRVFKQELEILMHVQHESIVKLLGFCDETDEGVLVLEYISSGSLYEKLHVQGKTSQTLSWNRRMAIAFQLAEAIEYLHDKCPLQIVHSDIKSSNVLLDENLNCKLCDFGSSKMGFSSMILPPSRNLATGSPGYVDPHYLRTGMVSKKTDVYSFGVLVLELITGMEAFCSEKGQLLTALVRSVLRDARKVNEVVDSKLEGKFNKDEAVAMASISALCLSDQPSLRPSMAEILREMREKIPSVSSLINRNLKENFKADCKTLEEVNNLSSSKNQNH